jgi:hypothetical protein
MTRIDLKPISVESVPTAIAKAEHYRHLGEPVEAESICLDVLAAEPGNSKATIVLLLALTDQFEDPVPDALRRAQALVPKLPDAYTRAYYAGIVCERQAKAMLKQTGPRGRFATHDWLHKAMSHFAEAEQRRPEGNDDAILRWNSCARILMRNPHLGPEPESRELGLE